MPPSEHTIFTTFLLAPSPLPTILPLQTFTALFPRTQQQQASPAIKTLYRHLQHQRLLITDTVTRNIAAETKRGVAQQRAVVRARRLAEKNEQGDDEVAIEDALFGQTSNLAGEKPHTLTSILPELEAAAGELEEEVRRLDEEAEGLLEEMRGCVGGLSDLRYGRLADGGVREEVLEGLGRLEGACGGR